MDGLKCLAPRQKGAEQETGTVVNATKAIVGKHEGKTIRFLGYDSEGRAINQAEIVLSTDELKLFMHAFFSHHLLLPTNYSQTIEQQGCYWQVRICTHESPKYFVARLSAALGCLRQPA